MSNYYKSKCCGSQVVHSEAGVYQCIQCGNFCGVIAMIDTPYGVPKEDWKDKLQTEFMEFWDEYKDKLGLGNYSDEITRFWFEKMEIQKAELLSQIKGLGAKEDVDLVTVSKIINKLNGHEKM